MNQVSLVGKILATNTALGIIVDLVYTVMVLGEDNCSSEEIKSFVEIKC